jgi:hypothetical protein
MGHDVKPADGEIPYEQISEQDWGRAVASSFRYRSAYGAWMYFGQCPRCGHDTATIVGEGIIMRQIVPADPQPAPVTLPKLTVHCQCSHPHGTGKTGCGAFMNVYNVRFG